MSSHFFPCRPPYLQMLLRLDEQGRLAQPLLLVGPEGAGKEATALEFARLLNCAARATCGPQDPCPSCLKAATFQHPDICWIGPAPASFDEDDVQKLFAQKQEDPFWAPPFATNCFVGIGESENPGPLTVRNAIRFLQSRAFQGRVKVVIAADSQRLNAAAANAFLKTLEEPPAGTAILLLATATDGMLPTVLSRCRQIRFDPWPEQELAQHLQRVCGCPPGDALRAARICGGNARRAAGLLRDVGPLLLAWAWHVFGWIQRGDRGRAAVAADELHRGVPAHVFDAEQAKAFKNHGRRSGNQAAAGETAAGLEAGVTQATVRRDVAIQLCEWLNLIYSEAVKCRELGQAWRPLVEETSGALSALAAERRTATLLRDIALIEDARADIDRNLNIGLVMAVLFEGLIDDAQKDQTRLRAAAG